MTGDTGPDTRILGTLRSVDGKGSVRVEDRYDTGIEDLWSALTDPERLGRWFGDVEGELSPGGQFHLRLDSAGWEGTGVVGVCDPPRRLRVTTRESDQSWREGPGVPPFDQVIEATLTPDGAQTSLVIEVAGMPLETIAFFGVGWQIHAECLAAHLAGRDRGDTEARWTELIPAYQQLAAALD